MSFNEKILSLVSNRRYDHPGAGVFYEINNKRQIVFNRDTAHQYYHHRESGTPFLILSAKQSSVAYIKNMLGFPKINPNICDRNSMTALMHLARSCKDIHFQAANLFLNHSNININAVDNQNKTALHYAIDANNIHLAKTLINHKDIDLQAGHTPLFTCAVIAKKWSLLQTFLTNDPTLVDHEGRTILMHAIFQDKIDLSIKAIAAMSQETLPLQDTHGNTALHYAVTHKKDDVIMPLLEKAPDLINTPNNQGITPFAMACQQPHMNILNMMLKHQDTIALKTIYQSVNGNLKNPILDRLDEHLQAVNASTLASKINPIIRNRHNIVLLTIAISIAILIGILVTPISFFEIRFLIVFGVMLVISAFVATFNTTFNIHYCARNGQFDMIVYLIHDGAAINRQDADGKTPLMHAAFHGHLHIVKYLVEQGANKEAQNKPGNTALTLAAKCGHLDVVQYLVAQDAKIDMQNNYGSTALMWAAYKGHLNIVQYLVEKDANKDAQNNPGDTALIVAAFHGHLNIVKYLVEKGADTNIQGEMGKTALQWAQAQNKRNVVAFLQEHQTNRATNSSVTARKPIRVEPLKSLSLSDQKIQTVVEVSINDISIVDCDLAPSAPPLS